MVHDGAAAQVAEVLALAAVAGATPLPGADRGQGVFDGDPRAPLGSPHRRRLARAQCGQEALVGVKAHAAAAHTRRTALTPRTGGTDRTYGGREVAAVAHLGVRAAAAARAADRARSCRQAMRRLWPILRPYLQGSCAAGLDRPPRRRGPSRAVAGRRGPSSWPAAVRCATGRRRPARPTR